jgi:ABC-2 type transport system permease protein
MSSKIGLIITREYTTRVKKKSFIIMTFLGPLLFATLMIGGVMFALNDKTNYEVLIIDKVGALSQFDSTGKFFESRFSNRFMYNEDQNIKYSFLDEEIGTEAFKASPYNVMIELDEAAVNNSPCTFYFKKLPSEQASSDIRSELESAIEEFRVGKNLSIAYDEYKRIKVDIDFKEVNIEKLGQEDRSQQKAVVGFVFAIIIYFFIFMYGVQVMRGVIEEKTNRIVEVIISSVKPFQLMMGKVIGIGLVGLTQFVMWIALSLLVTTVVQGAMGSEAVSPEELTAEQQASFGNMIQQVLGEINWPLQIGLFVFYFIGGFLLYASLFAAIGAAVDNETDTQQFMAPITIPLIFGFIVAEFLIANPEGTAGQVFSIIPLTSPVVMMVKGAMVGHVTGSMLLSMLILVATFIFTVWIASKIYRVGILMYGKKPTYKELWKWMRYKA